MSGDPNFENEIRFESRRRALAFAYFGSVIVLSPTIWLYLSGEAQTSEGAYYLIFLFLISYPTFFSLIFPAILIADHEGIRIRRHPGWYQSIPWSSVVLEINEFYSKSLRGSRFTFPALDVSVYKNGRTSLVLRLFQNSTSQPLPLLVQKLISLPQAAPTVSPRCREYANNKSLTQPPREMTFFARSRWSLGDIFYILGAIGMGIGAQQVFTAGVDRIAGRLFLREGIEHMWLGLLLIWYTKKIRGESWWGL